MSITAIIVNYFSASFLSPLLTVLTDEALINEIIIVDNSNESGLAAVADGFDKVISFGGNIGFANAVNRVTAASSAGWFLLINPDTLPDKGFVESLIEGAEETGALIAGPRFYLDNEKTFLLPPALGHSWWLQTAMESSQFSEVDARLFSFYWALRHERFWNENQCFFEPCLSGACMLIRNDTSFFNDGEIFDKRFFLYCEDTDLCLRALLDDKVMVCVPEAKVVHYWNQSPSDRKENYMAESYQLFMDKHYGAKPDLAGFGSQPGFNQLNIFDLGEVTKSPLFRTGSVINGAGYFFEFGINPFFVPFAQAGMSSPSFEFPEGIWRRLQPGQFYSRIRNTLNQVVGTWKWKKI